MFNTHRPNWYHALDEMINYLKCGIEMFDWSIYTTILHHLIALDAVRNTVCVQGQRVLLRRTQSMQTVIRLYDLL
jgi:hypothetical protein